LGRPGRSPRWKSRRRRLHHFPPALPGLAGSFCLAAQGNQPLRVLGQGYSPVERAVEREGRESLIQPHQPSAPCHVAEASCGSRIRDPHKGVDSDLQAEPPILKAMWPAPNLGNGSGQPGPYNQVVASQHHPIVLGLQGLSVPTDQSLQSRWSGQLGSAGHAIRIQGRRDGAGSPRLHPNVRHAAGQRRRPPRTARRQAPAAQHTLKPTPGGVGQISRNQGGEPWPRWRSARDPAQLRPRAGEGQTLQALRLTPDVSIHRARPAPAAR